MNSSEELEQGFNIAINIINNFKKRPSDSELLDVYKYFKQAKFGNNNTESPGMLNFSKSAKWSAWKTVYGMKKEHAMQNYVELAMTLFKKYGS